VPVFASERNATAHDEIMLKYIQNKSATRHQTCENLMEKDEKGVLCLRDEHELRVPK
jgi:hypothetical protein